MTKLIAVNDWEDEEVSETAFTITEPNHRIEPADLPQSPRKLFKTVEEMGWEARAWLVVGDKAPTLYMAPSADGIHSIGDVLYDGYTARLYVVEARDPETRAIGFRAHFVGKQYADGRKAPAGGFDYAYIADPVGIPQLLTVTYKPIKQLPGKFETEKSFKSRVAEAKEMTDRMSNAHNDRAYYFSRFPIFRAAGQLDAWLAEWASFTNREITI